MTLPSVDKLSLRNRIFISMLFITLLSSVLMAAVMYYQYKKETRSYHQDRLKTKEDAIHEHLTFILNTSDYPLTTDNLPLILKDRIFELSTIHDIQINIHDLEGRLLISSKSQFVVDEVSNQQISPIILRVIESSPTKSFVDLRKVDGGVYRNAYSYIKDKQFKNLGIISIPYIEDTTFYDAQMDSFIIRFGQVYLFLLILSIVLSYFLSRTITHSIQKISEKILQTRIHKKNQKIDSEDTPREIEILVMAYNNMVDELEKSANLLAKSEREHAWREMAKQVAHEIKNPLTPMRLSVQMFERKFDPNHPDINEKVKDFSETLVQQIDMMSAVASAFSNFASMPVQKAETIDVVKVIALALEIFNEDYIHFNKPDEEVFGFFDPTHITRIVNNLVKNAIQAIPETQTYPEILVDLIIKENKVVLKVSDNGAGITEEHLQRIFEPQFTTKSGGMGLGLAMVKNIIQSYSGTIGVSSTPSVGTTFTVELPINDKI